MIKSLKKFAILLIVPIFLLFGNDANAAEIIEQDMPKIILTKYEITNERIIPGEEFTLSITIKNYSKTKVAKDVLINIQNPEGVAPVYGTISQCYIEEINAEEEKVISFDYDSWTTVKSDTLDFYVTITENSKSDYAILRVPSSAAVPFSLLAVNISEEAKVGEYNSAAMTFKVLGEENVSDVVLNVSCNDKIIGSSQAGSITAGTTKSQSVTFILDSAGTYSLVLSLDYVDSDGQKLSVVMDTKKITVTEDNAQAPSTPKLQVTTEINDTNNILILGLSGVAILCIFVLIIIIIRKKR